MRIFVFTCDKYLDALRGFAHFFNKYWSAEQQVVVCGFTPPSFDLPSNFTFFSIGTQEDYPVGKWSDGLLRVLYSFPKEKHIVLMLEDYWLCQPVNVKAVTVLYHYIVQFGYVIKMDIVGDRRFAGGVTDYGEVAGIPLVKSDPKSAYHSSLMTGIWSTDLMRKYIIPGESPWDVELAGTQRLSGYGDEMLVLGTKLDPWPLKHILAYRSNDPTKLLVQDMSQHDKDEVRGLGYDF